jgi:SIR2-like domain
MIDPINSLAFSMQANKGVYAVLIGSGVSRAARIPTGWEVTIELIRKAAAIQNANCEPDPAAWYRESTGNDPDYSMLLDTVAKTPAERQQLLRPYFEPTESEREEGAKTPTKAHRAIARLVKLGYVRVVITTNFDRLLEVALHDEGIQPTLLSTADQIAGAMPLVHTSCTVIKVHGDYLDTRILNTPEELASYPEAFDRLLDRVFDEFGLVVSGWSADWDEALRASIIRAPNRRFSTYWSTCGDPSDKAADLIARRSGIVVRSTDADTFFTSLTEQVEALEEFSTPHPLSSAAAVSALKRYLSEPKYRISLNDLIHREVDAVLSATSGAAFDVNAPNITGETALARVKGYEAAAHTLVQMAYYAGYWSDENQAKPWMRELLRLANIREAGGVVFWLDLQRYPAALLANSFGIGAVHSGNLNALRILLDGRIRRRGDDEQPVGNVASLWSLGGQALQLLPGHERQYTPAQNRAKQFLFGQLGKAFDGEGDFDLHFDQFEVLLALSNGTQELGESGRYWVPPGAWGWRRDNRQQVLAKIRNSLSEMGAASPFVTTGLVGEDVAQAEQNLIKFEEFACHLRWW